MRHTPLQLAQDLQLTIDSVLERVEDDRLLLFQLRREIALCAGERLLADVVVGNQLDVGVADLDVIAEDAVVADLQALDAGSLALDLLERGAPCAGRRRSLLDAERIEA